jgi:hypothetical protein
VGMIQKHNLLKCNANESSMQPKKKQITARIPEELYYKCNAMYPNVTDAVIKGLELLCNAECNADRNANEVNCNAECNASEVNCNASESINGELHARIEEKDVLINELRSQNNILAGQLQTKDTQIEKQSYHIQSLIQENSRLNVKLLPEAQEVKKKPWWQFW